MKQALLSHDDIDKRNELDLKKSNLRTKKEFE